MKIVREDFKNEEKKLKKYFNEKNNYEKIIMHIRTVNTYKELCIHPFSIMYGFERLKFISMNHYADFKRKKGIMG